MVIGSPGTTAGRSVAESRADGVIVASTAAIVAIAVIALVALWPLGIGHDYPNHLAVSHLEANLAGEPGLQQFYEIAYGLQPNLAMDVVVAPLSRLVGIHAAGAAFVAASILLPPLAGLLLARTLGHGRVSWVNLFVFAALFNGCLYWGLVEYLVTVGLALIVFSFWIRTAPRIEKLVLFLPLMLILAVFHALGLLLVGYMILLYEIGNCIHLSRKDILVRFKAFLYFELAALLIPFVFLMLVVIRSEGETHAFIYGWTMRWSAIISPFTFGQGLTYTAISLIAFVSFFYVCLREGWLSVRKECRVLCAGLLLLWLFAPYAVFGIELLQVRFGLVFVIVLAASCTVDVPSRRLGMAGGAVLVGLLAMQLVEAATTMRRTHRDMSDARSAFARIEPGSRLLSSMPSGTVDTALIHAAAYAVIDRDAFVPNLFTMTTPVAVTAEMSALSFQQLVPPAALAGGLGRELPASPDGRRSPTYFHGWPAHFDYLLFLRADPGETLPFTCLDPIAEHPRFVLYAIERPIPLRQHRLHPDECGVAG